MSRYDKKRLRILKRLLVGLTLFILSFTAVSFLAIYLLELFPRLEDWSPWVWIGLGTALVIVGYPLIDQAYGWLFRHVLFPRRSRVLLFLKHLAQDLALTEDLTEFVNLLVNTLGEVFQLKTVSLLLRAPRGEGYGIASAYGWSVSEYRKLVFPEKNDLVEFMKATRPQVLLLDQAVRSLSWQEANQLTSHFEALHATWVIPVWFGSELVGSINLLVPPSNDEFDEGSLRLFRDFGEEIAPSLQKALTIERLKRVNKELRDTQSQLVQNSKLRAIEQLATGIAHEVHNPLTIISGKAQVLLLQKDRKVYDEQVEEVLKTIVKQTQRAADITKKLLMFSRASASPRERLRLETVLEDTLSLIAYQTSLEGIEIRRLVGKDLPDFFGNAQELREVFLNLILNALQAIQPGGRIQVGLIFQKAEQVFNLQITDNGRGIPSENLNRIFNPFFTTRAEGIGLGLFITQQIVHRYGGSIRVESEPGEGTLIEIELPFEPSPSANPSTAWTSKVAGREVGSPTEEAPLKERLE